MAPNILFIVADDLNSWIEPLGRHPNVRTPWISELASRGTVFSRAYCTAPYCNASRMSVFTGCLPSTTGIYQNEPFWEEPLRRKTFLEHLRGAGYFCFGAGKVFHGNFDYALAGRTLASHAVWQQGQHRQEHWDYFSPTSSEPLPGSRPLNRMFDFSRFEEVSPWNHHFDWGVLPDELEEATPDNLTVRAVEDFLRAPSKEPFFCAAGLYKPHLPWYSPKRFFELYPEGNVCLPFVKLDDLDDVPEIARDWALSPPDHETVLKHGEWENAVRAYLAAISFCDHQVGRLLAALDASPAADNTMVVLWGDNGFHLGEKLHWRKFVLWEEATRVPFIVVPPKGQSARALVDEPVSLMDLFPTLCDLAGIDSMKDVDGVSLLPTMLSESATRGRPVITTWQRGNHSLRVDDWRYTRYHDGSEELYDHRSDPFEWTNLANAGQHQSTAKRFAQHLEALEIQGKKMDFFDRNQLFLRSSPVGNWPVRLNARYQAIVEANRDALEGANVLDIASHDGRWSYAVLDAGAKHVTGVEIRPELVVTAEENFRILNVDRAKYDFETADLFESDALSRTYDVILCLGFFYHTLRHLEAVERMVRCQPKLIILDTMITPVAEDAISLVAEDAGNPANGTDLWGVRNGKILVGHPSRSAVRMMFSHFGYEVTEFDWPQFIADRSIAYRQGEAQSGTNPMGDYGNAKRSTFVCKRVNGN